MRRAAFPVLVLCLVTLRLDPASGQSSQSGIPSAPTPSTESGNPNAAGVYNVGGVVRPPVLLSMVDPEFTEEARKKKIRGNVQVSLIVDENGVPQDVRVVHGLGNGLDEKAVEAVSQYKFRPARKGDVPVPVRIVLAVNFQIF